MAAYGGNYCPGKKNTLELFENSSEDNEDVHRRSFIMPLSGKVRVGFLSFRTSLELFLPESFTIITSEP